MRPQGVVGALVAIAVGATLTYAVSFTISGISIHTAGVIIMLAGVAALAILLVRSLSALRRRDERRPTTTLGPNSDTSDWLDPRHAAPQIRVTRASTDVYAAPELRQVSEPHSAVTYRTPRAPQ
ncbi:MAG TPA: hypothetical protein VFU74_19880 [Actinocrinis sp.]|nr:hypothetical protein [Actinocrinis sp.]